MLHKAITEFPQSSPVQLEPHKQRCRLVTEDLFLSDRINTAVGANMTLLEIHSSTLDLYLVLNTSRYTGSLGLELIPRVSRHSEGHGEYIILLAYA